MRTQWKRGLLALCLSLTASLGSAIAAFDPGAGDEVVAGSLCGTDPGPLDPECDSFGTYLNPASNPYLYRGNVYSFEVRAVLKEIKMELAFDGTTDLHVAIHRRQPNGDYTRYPENSSDIVIPNAEGCGAVVPHFYSTADANPPMQPVIIEADFDYAIAFAWGDKFVGHGRGGPGYVLPFRAGQVRGLVTAFLSPPPEELVPDIFVYPRLEIFGSSVYSMELCFEPQPGACCSSALGHCEEMLESECLASAGSFFYGEHTLCAETACDFGACCTRCGECANGYTEGGCFAEDGANHWPGVSCPAIPSDLCPTVTGACCRTNGLCDEVCEQLCNGVYQGDGTTCTPNPCKGACCISGFDCSERTPTSCAAFSPRFRGLGTTCATLAGTNECGGACCFGSTSLSSCQVVSQRAFCSYDSFPVTAYRGDGSTCPQSPATCGSITEYNACCLSDGTCINTTTQGTCALLDPNAVFNTGGQCNAGTCSAKACCLPDGDCDVLTAAACTKLGGAPPAGEPDVCGVSSCVTGACCFTDDGLCTLQTSAACTAAGGNYRGNGTNCTVPAQVCPGIGACCRSNGDCFDDLTSSECGTIGGEYQKDATVCDTPTVDCDQRGACCASTGTCLFITESQCNELDPTPGEFRGIGVSCVADTCPAGACCLGTSCEVRTEAGCMSSSGEFQGVDVACEPGRCIVGACCNAETCTVQSEADCLASGGASAGEGESCDPNPCVLGACCSADCTCTDVRGLECVGPESAFQPGVACEGGPCTSEIINSSPPNCAIDARQPHEPDDATVPLGWDTFDLTFRCGAAGTTETDFTVAVDPPATAPTIIGATVSINTVTLTLDRPIDPQAWTCFTHTESSNRICFGALPGDADSSKLVEAGTELAPIPADIAALVDNLADAPTTLLNSWQCDLDDSALCSPSDILTGVDLLNGADEFEPWLDKALIACPTGPTPP